MESPTENKRKQVIGKIASILHEEWRLTRLDEKTMQFKPRFKTATDQEWILAHGGNDKIDIANTSFDDLPEDWKKENLAAAEQALDLLKNSLILIHDRWLERNETDAAVEQRLRYDNLSEQDKEKDLRVLEKAIVIFRSQLK